MTAVKPESRVGSGMKKIGNRPKNEEKSVEQGKTILAGTSPGEEMMQATCIHGAAHGQSPSSDRHHLRQQAKRWPQPWLFCRSTMGALHEIDNSACTAPAPQRTDFMNRSIAFNSAKGPAARRSQGPGREAARCAAANTRPGCAGNDAGTAIRGGLCRPVRCNSKGTAAPRQRHLQSGAGCMGPMAGTLGTIIAVGMNSGGN